MDTEKACSAIRSLIRVRQLLGDALSPNSSLIPIDLLLAASCAEPGSIRSLTVKQLFAQLRHSDRAVRMHFNRLVADGMLIAEAGSGDEAIELARLHRPDLALLDVGMKGLNGLEALSQLRRVVSLSTLPAIQSAK